MYFYQTFYKDGTWDILRSRCAIRRANQVCETCIAVRPISLFLYVYFVITGFLERG